MRGKKKLNFRHPVKVPDNHSQRRLIAAAARYYYYTQVCEDRRTYEEVISTLSEEFYLSVDYLSRRLPDYVPEVLSLKPSIMELRKQFPHLNWK
jgi:hypothetical protein